MTFAGLDYPSDVLPEQVKFEDPVDQRFARLVTTRLNCLTIIIPR